MRKPLDFRPEQLYTVTQRGNPADPQLHAQSHRHANVPDTLAFYHDRLGFEITFQGPEPDDIFFGIVQRDAAMIMFKAVGVDPVPNYTRNVKQGIARWDAYLHVPDPDALAAEFSSRNLEFSEPIKDTGDGLRGFELKDADGYVLFFGRPRS